MFGFFRNFLLNLTRFYDYTPFFGVNSSLNLKNSCGNRITDVFLSIDSSKKRKRLRKKIQSEKNDIQKLVKDYNDLTGDSISTEDAENGTFPWLVDEGKY
jgi:hypothetical protein